MSWEKKISWVELEAAILDLLGAENGKAREGKRPFPDSGLAWATVRILRKAQKEGIGSLSPVDQSWLRDLRDRFARDGSQGLARALDLDRKIEL